MTGFLITSFEFELRVHLGVPLEERESKQRVRVAFKIYQRPSSLECCENDDADNYACYAHLKGEIKQYCSNHSFRLLEYLCYQLHKLIKQHINNNSYAYVKVEKMDLEIEGERCVAVCEYSDL